MVRGGAIKPSSLAASGASTLKRSRLAGVSSTAPGPGSDGDSGSGGDSEDDKGVGNDK